MTEEPKVPLKVAFVFMKFPGRQETFAGTEIRALLRHGVEVSAYALRWRPAGAASLLSHWGLEGLPVHWVSPLGYLLGVGMVFLRPAWSLFLLRRVFEDNAREPLHLVKSLALVPFVLRALDRIMKNEPDVVHLFWGHYPSLLGLVLRRFSARTRLSMFLGAYDLNTELGTSRRCAIAADAVFTHAKANLDRLLSLGVNPESLHLVYRGMDLSLVRGTSGSRVPGRVASVAYLEEEKGMRHVLEVFKRVKAAVPGASLSIIGDGPDRGYLEKRARELGLSDVEFKGHVPHKEVLRELSGAQVFLFLSFSKDDRLPNAVKEAIASGCVCVVSDTPGIEELVTHGVSGYVLPPSDYEAATKWVVTALGGDGRNEEIAGNALRSLRSGFDVMETTKGYIRVWEAMLGGAARETTIGSGPGGR
jgi:glycosyltransferase involved in cell wall biosynthesis